ncbi:unnamed protein product [Amoebophrya sp. A25]|nr:unnamed protein product [Amoebophrya sp. A25]|eukprot:GSA25T00011438001.1
MIRATLALKNIWPTSLCIRLSRFLKPSCLKSSIPASFSSAWLNPCGTACTVVWFANKSDESFARREVEEVLDLFCSMEDAEVVVTRPSIGNFVKTSDMGIPSIASPSALPINADRNPRMSSHI